MWKLERREDVELVVLTLSGQLAGGQLNELRKALLSEGDIQNLVLDLKQLRLVDQDAVIFLEECEAVGASLRNCPAYIRNWIGMGTATRELKPSERTG